MPYLTLNIDIQDRTALVVGGGTVALRKVGTLLAAGARVQVVAPALAEGLETLRQLGAISVRSASYAPADLEGVFLAVAASDNREVNAGVARDARERGILVAVANAPKLGTCTFPAILRRGELEIAVSSGGRCPAFSVQVRDRIAAVIGEEYATALERLAAEREKLLTEGNGSTYNAKLVRFQAERVLGQLAVDRDGA
ncbi:precorrin-2 dehydrogenase/sirohydrochlorin ferrochelatase family protein [Pelobacter propionicus]|uniref:precorrin-2 dehydrogenase n=1 Tax=Pelobacter propionicus (strain DSM 2379 / NBRC 103807 / OttBd1) TaxID=338966 RepID=A1AUF1_PELPD|nr:bifunctional precorrin-2 dehydrogenase/sirohydrochlorin ferrochelatase [Pelobacter propionicus]ABL00972.1 precorrin-2 dehydrogenase [Pelobacter propionicus DSM 2379]